MPQLIMKKLIFFFLLLYQSILFSQTVLNTYPLILNNPLGNGQALNVEDVKTHDIYVFAADDKKITILKYNKSLFLANQFSDTLRHVEDRTLIGHSISEDGNPTLYWSSQNRRNLRIIKYYLETKTSRALNFDFPENIEYFVTTFQKDNIFYIIAKEKNQQHLLLYEFQNGKCEIKMFDFSGIAFQNEKGQKFTFSSLIRYFPLQKMESGDFNSLDKTSGLNKMYITEDHILLTFDYNSKKTQVMSLNMESGEITEKNFEQPVSKNPSKSSNSFYSQNKLFQVKASKDEFLFEIKDFDSQKSIKSVSISKNDTIRFKNSPIFLQVNNEKPQELKTTGKFLKQLANLNVGVSVFKNNNNNVVTFGGFIEHIFSSAAYSPFDMSLRDFDDMGIQQYSQSKMVSFDALLNANYEFVNNPQQEPLAIDNIFYFLSINKNVSLQNILKLKNYYILSYYDTALKQFVLRKFTDGFIREDNGNPIMNKSQFSRPAKFEKLKFIEN